MVKRIYRMLAISGSFLGFIALLYGCATVPKEADLKESLKSAASIYWKLRLEDKYEDTYKMEDMDGLPAFTDYRDRAIRIKKIKIVSHSIEEVTIEGYKGMVKLKFNFVLAQFPKTVSDVIHDEWIFKGGKWRHKFPPE